MNASPLEQPGDIYRPFTHAESDVLRGFVQDVRRLGEMRFFSQVPRQASLTWEAGQPWRAEMEEPDDEAVRAAVTLFRQLYNHNEPGSFSAVFKLLKRSAHERGGPRRGEALAALDEHVTAAREAVNRGIRMGIVFDYGDRQQPITPRDIIDAYFHGHYLHARNDKSELASRLDDLQPWPRYTLYRDARAAKRLLGRRQRCRPHPR